MKLDKVEQARARHSENGFCRVIGCPECEIRRQERFGGKTLDRVKVEVVEGDRPDMLIAQLEAEVAKLKESERHYEDVVADYQRLTIEANERAQALGTEICGFVAAYVDLAEADTGSAEFQEFASLLITAALAKLHDASHRLAPVQHD